MIIKTLLKLKVVELKELCKLNDLKCTGNKDDIIKRLIQYNNRKNYFRNNNIRYMPGLKTPCLNITNDRRDINNARITGIFEIQKTDNFISLYKLIISASTNYSNKNNDYMDSFYIVLYSSLENVQEIYDRFINTNHELNGLYISFNYSDMYLVKDGDKYMPFYNVDNMDFIKVIINEYDLSYEKDMAILYESPSAIQGLEVYMEDLNKNK